LFVSKAFKAYFIDKKEYSKFDLGLFFLILVNLILAIIKLSFNKKYSVDRYRAIFEIDYLILLLK